MHRISADNPVRRRLFSMDDASIDNFVNVFQESAVNEKIEKMKKWNFDFEKEMPLEGTYIWYRADDPDWIGVKSDDIRVTDVSDLKEHDVSSIKSENEATPKARDEKCELKKGIDRKRKLNKLRNPVDHAVRRRIDF